MKILKKDLMISFALIFAIIILTIFNSLSLSLISKMLLVCIGYIIFFIYCKFKLGNFKNMISSPAFIYASVFIPYEVLAILMFAIDEYVPRIYYYSFNAETMILTTTYYNYIFFITIILFVFFNLVKKIDIQGEMKKSYNKLTNLFKNINVIDIIVLVLTIYKCFSIIKYGPSYFSLNTTQKRAITNNGWSHYANLFMVTYSLLISYYYLYKTDKKKKNMFFRIAICVLYWAAFLTCERRIFSTFLIGFIIMFFSKYKLKIKYLFAGIIILFALLISAAYRGNVTFKSSDTKDVLYMSLTEFYLTYSISNYYVYNMNEINKINGESYVKSSILYLFPSFIVKNKPKELAYQFYQEMGTNTGYSFNPVAEAILNFGNYAILFVPFLIAIIVLLSNKLVNLNFLISIIVMSFSLDFYRGQFANYFFDCVFCFVFIFLIFKVNYIYKVDE